MFLSSHSIILRGEVCIILNHVARGDYRISWPDCNAKPDLFFLLARFSLSYSYSPLKIILKQSFTSGSVSIAAIDEQMLNNVLGN